MFVQFGCVSLAFYFYDKFTLVWSVKCIGSFFLSKRFLVSFV